MKKGQIMSEEQKEKIRQKLLGHPVSEKTRKAVSQNMKGKTAWNKGMKIWWTPPKQFVVGSGGENHWNWQGGITPLNQKLRHSFEYRVWRSAVFARDNWTCQGCDTRGGRLEADHIKPWSLFPELRFEVSNGRTLCKECHRNLGWKGSHTQQQTYA